MNGHTYLPSLAQFQVYDPIVGRWRDAEAMSMLRSRVGVAVMRNRLYAIGGYNGTDRLNTVEVFDAETKQWSKVASMNCKRRYVVCTCTVEDRFVRFSKLGTMASPIRV